MKPNVLKLRNKIFESLKEVENPAVIEAFKEKANCGEGLMIFDIIVFVANIIFYACSLSSSLTSIKILSFINSLVVLIVQFAFKRQTYIEIAKVNKEIKAHKHIVDNNTNIIKCVNLVKFLGWTLIALTVFLMVFNSINIVNKKLYHFIGEVSVVVAISYGIMDKLIWQFFNYNNADINNLVNELFNTKEG